MQGKSEIRKMIFFVKTEFNKKNIYCRHHLGKPKKIFSNFVTKKNI